jgi:DNA-binding transcriptional regulator YdaS (Cro superfamily)
MMPALANTLHSRVVTRVCEALGGPEKLADRIGVSTILVRAWMAGALLPPPSSFFRIVDILHEAGKGASTD